MIVQKNYVDKKSLIKVKNFHCMTLQIDIVITTLSFLPATGYKTPSALCSAFFTISELFIYVPPFLSILLSCFCGINQLVSTNSFVFMIAQRGGNVNRIGAMRGGKGRKIPIQRGLYRWNIWVKLSLEIQEILYISFL